MQSIYLSNLFHFANEKIFEYVTKSSKEIKMSVYSFYDGVVDRNLTCETKYFTRSSSDPFCFNIDLVL